MVKPFSIIFCLIVNLNTLVGQNVQLNILPGYNLQLLNAHLSSIKVGFGIDFIPKSNSKVFFTLQNDFSFSRKGNSNQKMYLFSTKSVSDYSNNLDYDLRHFSSRLTYNYYANGSPFDTTGLCIGFGFLLDVFNAANIKYEPYDDSLYYFNEFFDPIQGQSGYAFDESGWVSIGCLANVAYLFNFRYISIRPQAQLGFYFNAIDKYIDIKQSKLFLQTEVALGFLIIKRNKFTPVKIL